MDAVDTEHENVADVAALEAAHFDPIASTTSRTTSCASVSATAALQSAPQVTGLGQATAARSPRALWAGYTGWCLVKAAGETTVSPQTDGLVATRGRWRGCRSRSMAALRQPMNPSFFPERDGYRATFRGALSVAQLEQVRLQAAEAFDDESLRWAVLDLREAWIDPPETTEEEARQLENLHFVAERVRAAVTPELRMAVVSADEVTRTLFRLCSAAVGLGGPSDAARTRSLAQFDDVETATAWARASDRH